jgi:hypothetical protein
MGIGKKRSGSFSVNSYLDGADPFGNPIPNAFIEAVPGNALNQCMCWGDQGGPLFYKGKIAGLASFRFVATCDEEGPGYYLSLHRFTDWIRDNLLEMDPISGDYSGNGSVGSEDYDIWKTNFGSSNLAADGNRNGIVDAADYVIWRQNLGAALGVGGSDMPTTRAVPEPASIPLLGAAVVFLSITFAMRLRTFEVHR